MARRRRRRRACTWWSGGGAQGTARCRPLSHTQARAQRHAHLVPEAGGLRGVPRVGHGVWAVHHVAVRRGRKLEAQPEHVHEVHHLVLAVALEPLVVPAGGGRSGRGQAGGRRAGGRGMRKGARHAGWQAGRWRARPELRLLCTPPCPPRSRAPGTKRRCPGRRAQRPSSYGCGTTGLSQTSASGRSRGALRGAGRRRAQGRAQPPPTRRQPTSTQHPHTHTAARHPLCVGSR